MERKRKLFIAKSGIILGVIPALIFAYEFGPDAGYSGTPGEGVCTDCHTGKPNSGQGSVSVAFPNGQSYTSGVKQHLVVTIADPATTQKGWGFQLTARSSSDSTSQAGTFASTDANTLLMCASSNLSQERQVNFSSSGNLTCPSGFPLQYIEHSLTGYNATRGHTGSVTYEFDWMPPSSSTGNIVIYVAGNAATGNLSASGGHIYTKTYTLALAASGPAIDSTMSVQNLAGAPNAAGQPVAPGSLVAIYGTSLAAAAARASNIPLPTAVGNVSVSFNGTSAPILGVTPALKIGGQTLDQITAVVPWEVTPGTVPVAVTSAGASSSAVNITASATAPGILPFATDSTGVKRPLVYNNSDNTFPFPADIFFFNLKTRPASIASDTVVVWCTGLGAVSSAPADGAAPTDSSGNLVQTTTNETPVVLVGGRQANVTFSGLTQYPGVYQINLTLDPNTPTGDSIPIQIQMDGNTTTDQLKIAVTN